MVVDFEATCCAANSFPREEMEIIEIGFTIIDMRTHKVINKFSNFVKPEIHTKLTNFCKDLTTIRQTDVDEADSLDKVMRRWSNLLVPYYKNMIWGSWGYFDFSILKRELKNKKITADRITSLTHVNLKNLFAKTQGNKARGLSRALTLCDLEFEGTAHRGIDDAINISRLIPYIFPKLNPKG